MTGIKICGINDQRSYAAAANADYTGFVFYPPSPRAVMPEQARDIIASAPRTTVTVGVFVDASHHVVSDTAASATLNAVQLHGKEDMGYIRVLRKQLSSDTLIIKAAKISTGDDVAHALSFAPHVDMLLLDAKPPKNALLPGGNGVRFDWGVLKGRTIALPWLLAGGIHANNIEEAIAASGAPFIDVSSAVEDAPGKKNPCAIRDIINQTRALSHRYQVT